MLTFNVVKAVLDESFGGIAPLMDDIESRLERKPLQPISAPHRKSNLRFLVELQEPKAIVCATGERLVSGSISVLPTDRCENENGIGLILPCGSDKLDIRVGIPTAQFYDLTCAFRAGRIPPSIDIDERGTDYDGTAWDTKEEPFIHVASISLSIPIETEKVDSASQLLLETVSRLNYRVGWLVALVAVLMGFSLWRLF